MANEWATIFSIALAAGSETAEGTAPQVGDYLREIGKVHEQSLRELAGACDARDIDAATFRAELRDQAHQVALDLQALAVMRPVDARRAVGAFVESLAGAVLAGPAVLAT
jgi:hypothetical protein